MFHKGTKRKLEDLESCKVTTKQIQPKIRKTGTYTINNNNKGFFKIFSIYNHFVERFLYYFVLYFLYLFLPHCTYTYHTAHTLYKSFLCKNSQCKFWIHEIKNRLYTIIIIIIFFFIFLLKFVTRFTI